MTERDVSAAPDVPLVVDLDGSLVRTDLRLESFWAALGRAPVGTAIACLRYLFDRPALKHALHNLDEVDPALLPYSPEVLDLCEKARADGRDLHLVSRAPQPMVERVASHLGLDGPHFGTSLSRDLSGSWKADLMRETFESGGFDYVGDTVRDIPVWKEARKAYVVRPFRGLRDRLTAAGIAAEPLGERWRRRDLVTALRPRLWVKNLLLLFLPVLAARQFEPDAVLMTVLAAVIFCAASASAYLVDDLLDLGADRRHTRRQKRPFAAGTVPLHVGMLAALALGLAALIAAAVMGRDLAGLIAAYLFTALVYSIFLKRQRWVDVAALVLLDIFRVGAGAVAAGVYLSGWMLGFVFPLLLLVGCARRLNELTRADTFETLPGRVYAYRDRGDLRNVAILSAIAAIAVFLLYSLSVPAAYLYESRFVLQCAAIPFGAWTARMILTAWGGNQEADDPMLFTLRDPFSLGLGIAAVALLLAASPLF